MTRVVQALSALGVLLSACLVHSQGYAHDYSRSTSAFFTTHASTRAAGMGGAQAAVTTDQGGAEGWNPAGLRASHPLEIAAVYVRDDSQEARAAVNISGAVGKNLQIGGSFCILNSNPIDLNSTTGREALVTTPRTMTVALTAASRIALLESDVDLGCSMKLLSLAREDLTTITCGAMDFGVRWALVPWMDNLFAGISLKNLSVSPDQESGENLDHPRPEYILAGMAYTLWQEEASAMLLAADGWRALTNYWGGNFGLELRLGPQFSIRGGYQTGYAHDPSAGVLGMGFEERGVKIEYGLSLPTQAGAVHSMTIHFAFGDKLPLPGKHNARRQEERLNRAAEREIQDGDTIVNLLKQAPVQKIGFNPKRKIAADIIGVQRLGGRVTDVVLNVGTNKQVLAGSTGLLVNTAGVALAGIHVWDAYPDYSYANVIGLGKDLEKKMRAVLEDRSSK